MVDSFGTASIAVWIDVKSPEPSDATVTTSAKAVVERRMQENAMEERTCMEGLSLVFE